MRVGDFSVQIVAAGDGTVRELESGHVLARPGQVYFLRLRNHGPLRAVADISIDGHSVTGGGLVIDAGSTVNLERPIHATERGRFTVIVEGNEDVFGPDGGRDNPDLGLIEARFRRELPGRAPSDAPRMPAVPRPIVTMPGPVPGIPAPATPPGRPFTPPEWTPPTWQASWSRVDDALGSRRRWGLDGFMAPTPPAEEHDAPPAAIPDAIERAAGTGLTGASTQEFASVHVGPLETEATVIRLRLVIGSDASVNAPRPLPESDAAPARPLARP
jgi:hypothetical protein